MPARSELKTNDTIVPARTPGPLGFNDAGDPSTIALPGDTPGPWGINDAGDPLSNEKFKNQLENIGANTDYAFSSNNSAGGTSPLSMLLSMVMGAAPLTPKIVLAKDINIELIETKPTILKMNGAIIGGGQFFRNADGVDNNEKRILKRPEIGLNFNEKKRSYEINSIKIYTHKLFKDPDDSALPNPGVNITNDKELENISRNPPYDSQGKGHWKAVTKNMQNYFIGNLSMLQWYISDSNRFHENVHYLQLKKWINTNKELFNNQIIKYINESIDLNPHQELSERYIEVVAQNAVIKIIDEARSGNEDEAYNETFNKVWKPEIEKINKYARDQGWN